MKNTPKLAMFMRQKMNEWSAAYIAAGGPDIKPTLYKFVDAVNAEMPKGTPEIQPGDMSWWMNPNGRSMPGYTVMERLSKNPLIGPGIWEAADRGYLVQDALLLRTLQALEGQPEAVKEQFARAAEKMASMNQEGAGQLDLGAIFAQAG